MNSRINSFVKHLMPLIISLLSFSILIIGTVNYSEYKKDIWEQDVKSRLFEILMTKKTKLEKALYSRIYYSKSVAAYVSLKPDLSESDFYNLAAELIKNDSVISTMALSKNCVIAAIYPLEGHEAAIGLDLLDHPERREIVEKTIETRKTFIAGPVELVEGGIAFISYTPVFSKFNDQEDKFWGVTDIVIYQDKLIKLAMLNESDAGFLFAIRGFNGMGNEGAVWWGNEKVFEQDPVSINIDLPYGNWVLAAVPEIGWSSFLKHDQVLLTLLIITSFIISILIWFVSKAVAKIKRNEEELSAIFHSMDSLIIEFDSEARYIKIPPVNAKLLVKPKAELLNRTVHDIFSKDQARLFHNAILQCLDSKKLVEIEYPLQIGENTIWFIARISWKSDDRVIFHAFDATEQKKVREEILNSEKKLKELNATKDKFFSIIAHDLRSPFNIILGYSDLLKLRYDETTEDEKRKIINRIGESSKVAYELLEKLLLWSMSQSNNIKIVKEKLNLKELVVNAIEAYIPGAVKKSIEVEIDVSDKLIVYSDKLTIITVIGNLFNNAVKYTEHEGYIKIKAVQKDDFIQVSIADNGVGIPKENISKLFRIEESVSTLGTDNERGTGLGLLLCEEFIKKNEGKLWAESEIERGSTFYFTLPVENN